MRQQIIDIGEGPPLVVVPGIQGHWEWMRPAVTALSAYFRVVSYSLAGEHRSTHGMDATTTFEHLVDQLDGVIERCRLDRPIVCGILYGGLVAVHHAARQRARIPALILVSTPSPGWRPDPRLARYRRAPRLFAPLFGAQALRRLMQELSVTYPERRARLRFMSEHAVTVARTPMSPSRASRRLALIEPVDFASDCRDLAMPVLVITGERHLDSVVPVADTLEYRSLIPHARIRTIERTGHLGAITRPDTFAELIAEFYSSLGSTSGVSAMGGETRETHDSPRGHDDR